MGEEEIVLAQDELAKNPEVVEAEPKSFPGITDTDADVLLDAGMGGEAGKFGGNLKLAKNGHVSSIVLL